MKPVHLALLLAIPFVGLIAVWWGCDTDPSRRGPGASNTDRVFLDSRTGLESDDLAVDRVGAGPSLAGVSDGRDELQSHVPVLTGRALRSDGAPAVDAVVRVWSFAAWQEPPDDLTEAETEGFIVPAQVALDELGRFLVEGDALEEGQGVVLEVSAPEHVRHRQLLAPLAPPYPLDLGDLQLLAFDDEPALLRGRVLRADGEPAEGAEVWALFARRWKPLPLDAAGTEAGGMYAAETETCDAEGVFEFRPQRTRNRHFSLSVISPGHAPLRLEDIPLAETRPHDLGDLQLEPGAELRGRVVDAGGHGLFDVDVLMSMERGVPGFAMTYPGRGIPLTETDSTGFFIVDDLTEGPWVLLFDAPGYRVAEARGNTFDGVTKDIAVTLERGAMISGRVEGIPEGAGPLAVETRSKDVDLTASEMRVRWAELDEDGQFRISGLWPEARVQLVVCGERIRGRRKPIDEVPSVEARAGDEGVVLRWRESAHIAARIVDAQGAPVENFVAKLEGHRVPEGQDKNRSFHEAGELVLEEIVPQDSTRELSIRASGFEDCSVSVPPLPSGADIDLGDIALTSAPIVRVRVRDPVGRPLARARVYLARSGSDPLGRSVRSRERVRSASKVRYAETDSEGEAIVAGIVDAECALAVSFPNCAPDLRVLPASSERERSIEVDMKHGATLRVVVATGEQPRPRKLVRLEWLDGDPEIPRVYRVDERTDADGVAEFSELSAGRWRARIARDVRAWQPPGYDPEDEWVEVELRDGALENLMLEAEIGYDLRGVVREIDRPLAGTTILLRPIDGRKIGNRMRGSRFSTVADERGRFLLEDIPAGTYHVFAEHDSRSMLARRLERIGPDSSEIDWLLGETSVRGRVVDEDGTPLRDITLVIESDDERTGGWNDNGVVHDSGDGELGWYWHQDRLNEARSDASGQFEFRGCNPDMPLRVLVESPMKRPATVDVGVLVEGERRQGVRVVVRPAGCVKVLGWPGIVASQWRAVAYPIDEDDEVDRSGEWRRGPISSWHFVYESMRPGPWQFTIERRDGESWTALTQHRVAVIADKKIEWRAPKP